MAATKITVVLTVRFNLTSHTHSSTSLKHTLNHQWFKGEIEGLIRLFNTHTDRSLCLRAPSIASFWPSELAGNSTPSFQLKLGNTIERVRNCSLNDKPTAMESRAAIQPLSCDAGFTSTHTEVENDPSSSWLDLIDWTSLNPDVWVDGDVDSIFNKATTDDSDFHGFDGQLIEARAISTNSQHHPAPAQEDSNSDVPSMEKTNSELLYCPKTCFDSELSDDGRLEDAVRPGRTRKQTLDMYLSSGCPAPGPSPAPRRKGRLSDLVRTGMQELKHANGACWRCKILRKKVSPEPRMELGNLVTILTRTQV